eukprot:445060-Prymnesium_polylepis.1
MQTISGISASMASRIAAAAAGGGTYSTVASAFVSFLASATSLKTGRPRWVWPAFFGLTPPTIFVPYAIACSQWNVAVLPVKPWQMTLVSLKTAGGGGACETRHNRGTVTLRCGSRPTWHAGGECTHRRHPPREVDERAAAGSPGRHH